MTGHAGRGTPRQRVAGLVGALVVGIACWAALAWGVVQAVKGLG